MSRTMKGILVLVMAAALAVAAVLGAGILRDAQRVRELEQELAQSRATWEKIAEEKEALQEDLKKVTGGRRSSARIWHSSTWRSPNCRLPSVRMHSPCPNRTRTSRRLNQKKTRMLLLSRKNRERLQSRPLNPPSLPLRRKKMIDTGRMTCYNS